MSSLINNRRTIILASIVTILLLPLIGMQFSNEVNWTGSDFLIAGILLPTLGLGIELVFQIAKNKTSRIILVGLILLVGFLIWAELAVGLFGSPFAGS